MTRNCKVLYYRIPTIQTIPFHFVHAELYELSVQGIPNNPPHLCVYASLSVSTLTNFAELCTNCNLSCFSSRNMLCKFIDICYFNLLSYTRGIYYSIKAQGIRNMIVLVFLSESDIWSRHARLKMEGLL